MYLQDKDPRQTQFFGFDWQFKLEEEQDYRPVQLPHDWSVEYPFDKDAPSFGSGGYVKTGVGLYKKTFTIAPEAKGRKVMLHFEGAYMCTSASLNGKPLGDHVYGYTPFEFDITDALNIGENELTVRVDNSQQPNSRWYTGSGITRNVWLKATNPVHVPTYGTYITTSLEENGDGKVNIATKVANPEGKNIKLVTTILDATGKQVAQAETTPNSQATSQSSTNDTNNNSTPSKSSVSHPNTPETLQQITIQDPNLWCHNNPYLYKAVTTVKEGDIILDQYETTFGIRTVEFDPDKGCLINGEQVKLNGVCLHHDGGAVGAAVPKKLWYRRLLLLKDMGCNAIRTAHNPPDTSLLEVCDELGFYVMDEAFDEWDILKWKSAGSNTHESRGYSEWFKENYVYDMEAMLYRDRNHASVIMWSIGNEVPEQASADGHILAKELQDICHKVDPSRLCTQGNDQICSEPRPATQDFLNALDIVGYNYTGRWRTRAETLYHDDKRANPNWLILGTENPSVAGVRGDYSMNIPINPWRRPYFSAPVNAGKLLRFTMTHDYVIGDFMWTGIDHLGEAHWPHRSSSSGPIDTAGFAKDPFYFYKSIWNRETPMAHVFPNRNLADIAPGTVLPVLVYTNCKYAELFVNGKSYGKKAYSYPLYGMTETYGHFDTPPVSANTDDLFLSWDVPYEPGTLEVVGYDFEKELCRHKVETAAAPAQIKATPDTASLQADGQDIAHIEIAIHDENGLFHPEATNNIAVKIEGPAELIGIDNGFPASHVSLKGSEMPAHKGLLLAMIRTKRESGKITVHLTSDGLKPATVELTAK